MNILNKIIINFFIILMSINVTYAETIYGNAKVIDGDTIRINKDKVRLHGIDAPEKKQICQRNFLTVTFITFEKNYQCGLMSMHKLEKLIENKNIKCLIRGKDIYKRKIGTCYKNKININSWMVRNGYAVAYKKYSTKYSIFEEEAKENKLGLWQGEFEMPWEWRKNRAKN